MALVPYIGEIASLATALMWVLCALAFTEAGKHVGSIAVNVVRLMMAGVMYSALGLATRGLAMPLDATPHTVLLLAGSGLLGFFLGDLCLFEAYLLIGPRLCLLILALVPPLTALGEAAATHAMLGGWGWLAMAVTLGGVTWVVLERPADIPATAPAGDGLMQAEQSPPVRAARRRRALGVLLAVAAAIGQAGGLVLSKLGVGTYDPFAAAHIRLLAALPAFAILITCLRRWGVVLQAVRHARAMGYLTFGAFTGPFLGVALTLVALKHSQAAVASTIMATSPVLILPLVIVLYRERISPRAWLGALVALVGVALLCGGDWLATLL